MLASPCSSNWFVKRAQPCTGAIRVFVPAQTSMLNSSGIRRCFIFGLCAEMALEKENKLPKSSTCMCLLQLETAENCTFPPPWVRMLFFKLQEFPQAYLQLQKNPSPYSRTKRQQQQDLNMCSSGLLALRQASACSFPRVWLPDEP